MNNKQIVCVLGAGVGGLTAAHELAKDDRYEIHVYERNHEVGGQSRSCFQDGKHTEICWHAVSSGYNNLPRILSEVKLSTKDTALDHLKPFEKYHFFTDHGEHVDYDKNFLSNFSTLMNTLEKTTGESHKLDMLKCAWMYLKANSMCEERFTSDKYDDLSWKDYVSHLSKSMQRWAVDSTSIYLGMEYDEINAHLIMDLMRHNQNSPLLSSQYDFYAFDNSINVVWFDPWKQQLKEQGVHFHMHHDVLELEHDNGKITNIITKDNWWNKRKEIKPDIVINGLPPESLGFLYPIEYCDKFDKLSESGHQIQTQILYRIDHRINEPKNTVYILPDTPWFLMARHEGSLWNLQDRDLLSTGIGIWNQPGLNGKCAINCSPQELAEECWAQMLKYNVPFPENMPEWDIWNNFQYSEDEEKIWTWEPKFSNNIGTLRLRPGNKDEILSNLYHATAYTKTSMNIFNMESACEAGVETAKIISGSDAELRRSYKPNWFFKVLQKIDKFFYKLFKW